MRQVDRQLVFVVVQQREKDDLLESIMVDDLVELGDQSLQELPLFRVGGIERPRRLGTAASDLPS